MTDWDDKLRKIAEDAVGLYIEDTKHDMGLVLEAIDSIKDNVARIPNIEADVNELKGDMKIIKLALKATNVDVQGHDKRITKLEQTVFHA